MSALPVSRERSVAFTLCATLCSTPQDEFLGDFSDAAVTDRFQSFRLPSFSGALTGASGLSCEGSSCLGLKLPNRSTVAVMAGGGNRLDMLSQPMVQQQMKNPLSPQQAYEDMQATRPRSCAPGCAALAPATHIPPHSLDMFFTSAEAESLMLCLAGLRSDERRYVRNGLRRGALPYGGRGGGRMLPSGPTHISQCIAFPCDAGADARLPV